jgi:hypothetical protein
MPQRMKSVNMQQVSAKYFTLKMEKVSSSEKIGNISFRDLFNDTLSVSRIYIMSGGGMTY